MKKGRTYSILILTTGLMLALVATTGYALFKIRASNAETAILLAKVNSISEEAAYLQSLRAARNHTRLDIAELDRLVLNESEIVSLMESIERVGRVSGVSVNIISASVTTESRPRRGAPATEAPKRTDLVVEAKGSLDGILNFIETIELLPHRVMIEESTVSENDSEWRSKTTLSIYIF
jgi:Tfp pilus assembly protein PilO